MAAVVTLNTAEPEVVGPQPERLELTAAVPCMVAAREEAVGQSTQGQPRSLEGQAENVTPIRLVAADLAARLQEAQERPAPMEQRVFSAVLEEAEVVLALELALAATAAMAVFQEAEEAVEALPPAEPEAPEAPEAAEESQSSHHSNYGDSQQPEEVISLPIPRKNCASRRP